MIRKSTPTPVDAADSEALHTAIQALIEKRGRGGLTTVAEELGVTPSMLQKRLKVPGKAFDAPTLRAAILIVQSQAAEQARPPEQDADTQAQE